MVSTKKTIDRLANEIESKPSFKDLDSHESIYKRYIDDISKELMLKASVKEIMNLLDSKVNLSDINSTLAIIQKEVEICVREDDIKKSLNEQALVNEALCAENCLGRWIWKSGDLYHKNQVPWEV